MKLTWIEIALHGPTTIELPDGPQEARHLRSAAYVDDPAAFVAAARTAALRVCAAARSGDDRSRCPARRLLVLALTALMLAPVGCGSEDFDAARDRVEERFAERDRRRARGVRAAPRALRQAHRGGARRPRARRSRAQSARARRSARGGSNEPETIDTFMRARARRASTRYWTRTFAAADLPEPRVGFSAVPPGGRQLTACGNLADDEAAFYCPADDTIYVAQQFAAALYRGVLRGLPGERAGTAAPPATSPSPTSSRTSTRTTCSRSSASSTTP